MKTRTVATRGGDQFSDDVVDAIVVFHQEDGAWKPWSEHVLGVETSE